eukprot:409998-Amphidinium_carterae.1
MVFLELRSVSLSFKALALGSAFSVQLACGASDGLRVHETCKRCHCDELHDRSLRSMRTSHQGKFPLSLHRPHSCKDHPNACDTKMTMQCVARRLLQPQANLPPPRDSSERSSSNAMSLKTRSVRGNSD